MRKIGAVCIFFLGFGGFLLAQSDGFSSLETENPGFSASSADIVPTTASGFRQEGVASWYGAEFAGRTTASGEIFDPSQLTAAHTELPFGTYLLVTNTDNGKKIVVRVNDRGPFVRSRIIDVSRAAAERLDMLTAGTAKVVIEATTSEAAQSLARELGINPLSVARASPPAAAVAIAAPAPSANTAPAAVSTVTPAATPASATAQPAVAPAATPAPAAAQPVAAPAATPPVTPASAAAQPSAAPAVMPSATPVLATVTPSVTPVLATAQPSAAPAVTPSDMPVPPESAAPAAASTTAPATAAAGVPVMSPTAPRTPAQSPAVPSAVPGPSVSRVTGRVENIPEIRRSADSGYVVVDEQVLPAAPPAHAAPVIVPAPALAVAPRTATPATATPAPAAATPAAAATPVAAAPPPPSNPAASVPVTNPRPVGKIEFTGSPMVEGKNYRVQVGSFTDMKNASDIFLRLSDAGLSPSYEHYDDKYYRVVITNVKAEDAENLSRKLAELGITEALSREDTVR
jgi:rare lipoprotein A (peptidoglycan hydrolase)